jgi:DNA topoisomerase IA
VPFKLNTKKSNLEITSKEQAEKLENDLTNSELEITSNEKSKRKIAVKPPFITSTLQQTSSSMLGFSLSKTMKLAQDLYTGGYISYMRTDSPNISVLAHLEKLIVRLRTLLLRHQTLKKHTKQLDQQMLLSKLKNYLLAKITRNYIN